MKEQTKLITTEKDGVTSITELLAPQALSAAVVAGAIYDPKLPPLSGD